jgi:cyclic beta-1,2-glucan synthetase
MRPANRARDSARALWSSESLVRAEIFSAERLEQHAESLARAQSATNRPTPGLSLSGRLRDNDRVLRECYQELTRANEAGGALTPAAQWLIDNYHVIAAQVREIRADLPSGYYRQLPKLATGHLAFYPRVLGLAWAYVAHTDSHFDPQMLIRFVRAYQRVQPLTIGELWAVAITLRIILVENLRRAASRILEYRNERRRADIMADAILNATSGAAAVAALPAIIDEVPVGPLNPTFVVQLVARLREQDPAVTPALVWLDNRLAEQGTSADTVVQSVHQNQAAMSVTVRNIIVSMRMIAAVDWETVFESVSTVDVVLREASAFAQMDFPTRNQYRTAIERLARGAALSEVDVARQALIAAGSLAHAPTHLPTVLPSAPASPPDDKAGEDAAHARRADPGYYLIGGGRADFETSIRFMPPAREWPGRAMRQLGLRFYIGAVVALGLGLTALAVRELHLAGLPPGAAPMALFATLGLLPAIDVSVMLVNRLVTVLLPPSPLPGLALRQNVPDHLRTMVVIPALLTGEASIAEQIERLEIHYLSSPDGALLFALLTDWTDAPAATAPDDAVLLEAARAGIARLNVRYDTETSSGAPAHRFMLLHRRRQWNPQQNCWMGWERKRGKLEELNHLLRGATDTSFIAIDGASPSVPAGVRYVITLDSDTRLPRGTVSRLIGKMAHPLNRPVLDAQGARVVEGFGILQPRISPSLPMSGDGSVYQRAYSSPGGIDPYAAAVSDVYQDLFGEGSFAGKGIYDVDMFAAALAGRVPQNAMLSHDLFEGIFARAGLATDVEVVEAFPTRYDVSASRQDRWTRGDWQLLPWIIGRRASTVPRLGRWKMADNLRRSLTAPAVALALLAGWQLPPRAALVWSAFALLPFLVPPLLPLTGDLWPRRDEVSLLSHLRALARDARLAGLQMALHVILLAEQSAAMADAIARTLTRLYLTRRNLLQWTTAEQAKTRQRRGNAGHYSRMAGTLAIAAATAADAAIAPHGTWMVALPFAALWLAAPAVAGLVSRTSGGGTERLATAADLRALRLIGRRTWRFFETFVTPAENNLPPDNFQEDPRPVVAHRTSPTNIGLYLLSVAVAREFGWLGLGETVARLEATFATLDRMEKVNGHFLNWYDTTDLRPLDPKYVSSVDSGNLSGHLIALANACEAWIAAPPGTACINAGIADACALLRATLPHAALSAATLSALAALITQLGAFEKLLAAPSHSLTDAAAASDHICNDTAALCDQGGEDALFWARAIRACIAQHQTDQAAASSGPQGASTSRLQALAARARAMSDAMDFNFLLDPERKLLSIGFLVGDGSLDQSCYDLLASEARLASFLAIAKRDVPVAHWFRLGRAATPAGHGAALISWSGSMFEYLMPSLVMRAPQRSLLATTNRLIVQRQIDYATTMGLPWGMSESAFNARDLEMTYQYSNFGIPELALKRGLGDQAVIAPYATALAAMVDPAAAVRNFVRLTEAGALGQYGYYEALDYTASRLPDGQTVGLVRAFMAHHQGMSVVAIANAVLDGIMRDRFHTEPLVQANELLLQERTPRDVARVQARTADPVHATATETAGSPSCRRILSPHGASPAVHILSNGRYSVMLTAAGSGYSRWQGRAVTRWREDTTCDDWGSFIYLRDIERDMTWSAGFHPSGREADRYDVNYTEERVDIRRTDGSLHTHLEIVVSAEDDAEVRRVTLTNSGSIMREIELTSYMEIVLAIPADDDTHPAFSKMFVQTEFLPELGTLLATRRRRAPGEPEMWAAHLLVVEGETSGPLQAETDRARFIGRGRTQRNSAAMQPGSILSGTTGTVLDPVFSLRRRVRITPGGAVRLAFWTMAATTRDEVLDLADRHCDPAAFERASTLAWTQAQVQLRHLGISPAEAGLFQRLAGHLLYTNALWRPPQDVLQRGGTEGQSGLWPFGISGDLPILLVRIDDPDDLELVRRMLAAHEYWRMKQLAIDLVILNEKAGSYLMDLQNALDAAVRMGQTRTASPGGPVQGAVHMLRADLIGGRAQTLLQTVARAELVCRRGTLAEQFERFDIQKAAPPLPPVPDFIESYVGIAADSPPTLEFFNGLGGFAQDGREYVIILPPGQTTPAPWTNVVANPAFGFLATADGGIYSWWQNSRENQITAWSNDPITDRPSDVTYVRDEESGAIWGPTAQPIRIRDATYQVHHGMGYSRFRSAINGIDLDMLALVPLADPIRIVRLTIRNASAATRRLSVSWYVEWSLGPSRPAAAPHIVTEHDVANGAVLASNPWNTAFGPIVGFAAMPGRAPCVTGDRAEFLGRNGNVAWPGVLARALPLSNRTGAGLEPCAALQTSVTLAPGASTDLLLLLGASASTDAARELIATYQHADVDELMRSIQAQWDGVVGTIQVTTPDRSMDIMLNSWLLYQTLACRVWARAGFYQASGAYGFRDQLQDGMALAVTRPDLTRAHLLAAAGRQFPQGDVQHWWLPPSGRGVRTLISDDRAWLTHATTRYLAVTGDLAVLDELIPFLDGPVLADGSHENYFQPETSSRTATLFEHCALALDTSLATGHHGLPLIGTGDWNDGMSRVGIGGQGESIWLAWFLHSALLTLAPLAEARGEATRAATWRQHADALRTALEDQAWDGDWYLRCYFDDGTAFGAAASDECRIDSIAQSWAVISGAARPDRAARAMQSLETSLVDWEHQLALLFTPPFDRTHLDPGYIKGYPPGLRENGGQYTHAATWTVIALAMQGHGDRAAALFHMLNPINHAHAPDAAARYKVEPYVVAADVYAAPTHVGRGGWTWYTGSAAWLYRAGLEHILGIRREAGILRIAPCIPQAWPHYTIRFRHGTAHYQVTVKNPDHVSTGLVAATLDGVTVDVGPLVIPLVDDGGDHDVQVVLGRKA